MGRVKVGVRVKGIVEVHTDEGLVIRQVQHVCLLGRRVQGCIRVRVRVRVRVRFRGSV